MYRAPEISTTMFIRLVVVVSVLCTVSASVVPIQTAVRTPHCEWNGTFYAEGDSFQMGPCSPCTCGPFGQPSCAVVDCLVPLCVNPTNDPTKCCPVCPHGRNCLMGNMTIPAGKDFQQDNMTVCRCPDSPFNGNLAVCRIQRPPGCMYHGKHFPVGPFQPTPCEQCQCEAHTGQAICATQGCSRTPMCVDAVRQTDTCCPVCPNGPNCYVGNKKIPAGQNYNDGTQICRCPDHSHFHLGISNLQAVCKHH